MQNNFLLLSLLTCIYTTNTIAQESRQDALNDIQQHREKERQSFTNPEETPLTDRDLEVFEDLEYYPIDLKFRVKAKFKKYKVMKLFYMKTSTDRLPKYGRYAEISFEIDKKIYQLQAYQNQSLLEKEEYENYLFIPFTDLTSADTSYGGGRYLDIDIPAGDEIILDFNKSYNPYCAYNSKYSCPIPPRENDLNVEILAGIKNYDKH